MASASPSHEVFSPGVVEVRPLPEIQDARSPAVYGGPMAQRDVAMAQRDVAMAQRDVIIGSTIWKIFKSYRTIRSLIHPRSYS